MTRSYENDKCFIGTITSPRNDESVKTLVLFYASCWGSVIWVERLRGVIYPRRERINFTWWFNKNMFRTSLATGALVWVIIESFPVCYLLSIVWRQSNKTSGHYGPVTLWPESHFTWFMSSSMKSCENYFFHPVLIDIIQWNHNFALIVYFYTKTTRFLPRLRW